MPSLARPAPIVAAVAACLGLVAAAGCSALVDVSGLSGGPNDAAPSSTDSSSGGTADARADTDTRDADSTTDGAIDAPADAADTHFGPNLLPDSSFENGCGWGGYQGTTVTDSTTARTGTKSCRVCTSPSTTDYFTGNGAATAPPVVATKYHAVAWVRTAPGAAVPGGAVLFLRTENLTPFTNVEQNETASAGLPLTDTWQKLEVDLTATKPAERMDTFVGTNTAPGACFLIDDVWLEKL